MLIIQSKIGTDAEVEFVLIAGGGIKVYIFCVSGALSVIINSKND